MYFREKYCLYRNKSIIRDSIRGSEWELGLDNLQAT
jgi:hypothetical protein